MPMSTELAIITLENLFGGTETDIFLDQYRTKKGMSSSELETIARSVNVAYGAQVATAWSPQNRASASIE